MSELGFTKPLIQDFFQHSYISLRKKSLTSSSMSGSGDAESSGGNFSFSNISIGDKTPVVPAPQVDAFSWQNLFALTPSVSEPPRVGHGGVLAELESLHVKHRAEYDYLIPALSMALNSVIAAHETWQRETDRRHRHLSEKAEDDFIGDASADCGVSPRTVLPTLVAATHMSSSKASDVDAGNRGFLAFETTNIPTISVSVYVRHVVHRTFVSPSTLLVACLYLDRLLARKSPLLLTLKNVFKLFATALRIASKVMDTRTLNNKHFAHVGGFPNSDLNRLEALFLAHLNVDLFVGAAEFRAYARRLSHAEPPAALSPALSRAPSPAPALSRAPSPAPAPAARSPRLRLPSVTPRERFPDRRRTWHHWEAGEARLQRCAATK